MTREIHDFNPENGPHPDEDIGAPPTERQIAYAEQLAEHHGVDVSPRAYVSQSACGAFIGSMAKKRRRA